MSASIDTLALLSAAISATDEATETSNLKALYKVFQTQPGSLPPLFPTLVTLLDRAGEGLKKWIVDVIDLAFCKPTLGPQSKASCECSRSVVGSMASTDALMPFFS